MEHAIDRSDILCYNYLMKCPNHHIQLTQSKFTPTSFICSQCKSEGSPGIWDITQIQGANNSTNLSHDYVKEIMEEFNFYNVHSVMKMTGWHWHQPNGSSSIPTLEQIKESAQKMMETCLEKVKNNSYPEGYYCCSGGFEAFAKKYPNQDIILELKFVLESFESEGES